MKRDKNNEAIPRHEKQTVTEKNFSRTKDNKCALE